MFDKNIHSIALANWIIETSIKPLADQGQPSYHKDGSVIQQRYRGHIDDRCIIGHLIDGCDYHIEMETQTLSSKVFDFPHIIASRFIREMKAKNEKFDLKIQDFQGRNRTDFLQLLNVLNKVHDQLCLDINYGKLVLDEDKPEIWRDAFYRKFIRYCYQVASLNKFKSVANELNTYVRTAMAEESQAREDEFVKKTLTDKLEELEKDLDE